MTVSSTTPVVTYLYTGPGDYSYLFKAYNNSDIRVDYTDTSGVLTTLVENFDYTLLRDNDDVGGTVTTTYTPTTGTLEIVRLLPFTQEVALENQGPLDMNALERALDRNVMVLQQMKVEVDASYIGSNWRGTWATDRLYEEKDMVYVPTGATVGWYFCNTDHTSDVIADDITAGYWTIAIDPADVTTGEPALGNPGTSGYVLSSTTGGVRSWVPREEPLGSPDYDGMALVSSIAGVRSWGFPEPSADGSALLKVLGDLIHCDTITKSGAHTIQIDAVKCRSNDNSTLLSRASDSLTILSGVNTTYFVFVVRLVSGGSTVFKAYTTFAGADSDVLVVPGAWRLLTIVINDGSGNLRDFIQRREEVTWTVPATMPVIAATLTTSIAAYDLSSFLPVDFIEYCEYMFTAAGTGYVSLSYDLSTVFLTIPYSATDTNKTARFPVFTTVWGYGPQMKYTTVNCSVKVLSAKLRR